MEFAVPAPSDMDGILMNPANLEMSRTSSVTMGPTGLLMYESFASMSNTSPSLLAIMVRALAFLNCSCKSGNCSLIVCVRSASAPWALASKSRENLEKERVSRSNPPWRVSLLLLPLPRNRRGSENTLLLRGWWKRRRWAGGVSGTHEGL